MPFLFKFSKLVNPGKGDLKYSKFWGFLFGCIQIQALCEARNKGDKICMILVAPYRRVNLKNNSIKIRRLPHINDYVHESYTPSTIHPANIKGYLGEYSKQDLLDMQDEFSQYDNIEDVFNLPVCKRLKKIYNTFNRHLGEKHVSKNWYIHVTCKQYVKSIRKIGIKDVEQLVEEGVIENAEHHRILDASDESILNTVPRDYDINDYAEFHENIIPLQAPEFDDDLALFYDENVGGFKQKTKKKKRFYKKSKKNRKK